MGAGVSREHAKLPFGYTHARREEHACSALASSSLASRRQRLAHRLLLIKGSDSTTAISPLASHRLLLAEDDTISATGERASFLPTAPFASSHSLALGTADDDDSDYAEIVSLSFILNEGPQVQLRWHAVGQDQELDHATHNGSAGAMVSSVHSRTEADSRAGAGATAVDSDSGHDSCFPHSRSTTLDSLDQSSGGLVCPHAIAACLADPETAAALPLSSTGPGSRHFASAEILARQDASEEMLPSPLTTSTTGTTAAAATPNLASPGPSSIPAGQTAEQTLTDDDSDCEGIIKRGDRKLDLIAALGIAEVPEDAPVHVPFDSFTDEPIYHHSVPDLHCIYPTSRRYNVRHYSGSQEIEPRTDYDHNGAGARIPGGFFDGYRAPHDSDDEGLGEDMDADTEDDLTHIGLCSYGIVKLSCNIRLLSSATGLQICCNDLCSVPTEIGFLRNLTLLDLSKNSLTSLPDSIRHLTKLVDLRLSHNFLEVVPPAIGEFSKLTSLQLDNNRLERIPAQIGKIKGLAHLNLENNPLTILPAEIGHLQYLRRLRIDNCPLLQRLVHSSVHSPPTLLELAARVVVRQRVVVPNLLPEHLRAYLKTSQRCSFCEGPYFEASFKRGKLIEKNNALIPLESHAKSESSSGSMNGTDTVLGSPSPAATALSLVGSPAPAFASALAGSGLVSVSAVPNVDVTPSHIHGCMIGSRTTTRTRSSSGSGINSSGSNNDNNNNNSTSAARILAECSPPAKSRFSIRLRSRGDRTLVASP
ncbi:hypothetical protein BGZ70_001283 [Mortierella alpina]|uniref:Adenylate cyclase n=1 Tax=Mortierella alpina TaxID=64518 RepID=A0A9P6M5S5_MORAP|nr:hypothetical protein BGZ70_001283 [Mortierella alpina]